MAKVGDKFLFSQNGESYYVKIINVNDFREPNMKYGADLYSADSKRSFFGDVVFFGEDFLRKCKKIN